jgi:release factor glutamine methyltransferase
MPDSLKNLIIDATQALSEASPAPRLDAELLLAHALGKERSHLHAHPEDTPDAETSRRFRALVTARLAGEPIAYLTSKREFWSLDLKVTPATLIPRHETELLVELALERIPAHTAWSVLDLGTGSGALALAVARERPRCRITATDESASALAVAAENARTLGLDNLEFVVGDWFTPLSGRSFHLVLSNPPYVPERDPHLGRGDVRFEPMSALAAGPEGLDDLRRIALHAMQHLEDRAWLLMEHGHDQGGAVRALLASGGFTGVTSFRDLTGLERVTGGMRTGLPAAR